MPRKSVTVRKISSGLPQLILKRKPRSPKIDRKEYDYHYKEKPWKILYNPSTPMGNSLPPVAAVVISLSVPSSITTLEKITSQPQELSLATATKHISETLCDLIGQFKWILGSVYLHTRIYHLLTIYPGRDTQVPLWYFFIGLILSCDFSILGGGGVGASNFSTIKWFVRFILSYFFMALFIHQIFTNPSSTL